MACVIQYRSFRNGGPETEELVVKFCGVGGGFIVVLVGRRVFEEGGEVGGGLVGEGVFEGGGEGVGEVVGGCEGD